MCVTGNVADITAAGAVLKLPVEQRPEELPSVMWAVSAAQQQDGLVAADGDLKLMLLPWAAIEQLHVERLCWRC